MANVLYPFKFKPIYKDKIWGGRKIKDILHQDFGPMPNCGEVWIRHRSSMPTSTAMGICCRSMTR